MHGLLAPASASLTVMPLLTDVENFLQHEDEKGLLKELR